ncbi:transmembrane channel-like protein 7 isoform X2 [Watersipora subatra]|uniref:transmembrane channel-like protein 7 isoform X2 n=1 Tax=Watersipora subatra TaxID=2589382 RepID=UPI00355AEE89
MDEGPQPSTSQAAAANNANDSSSDDDYLEIFDPDKFIRDGNDIRFQLPSSNAALTLGRNLSDIQKKTSSMKRRNTTRRAIVRRKSTKPPTLDRSTKPRLAGRQLSQDYDEVDTCMGETDLLMSSEEAFKTLQGIRESETVRCYPVRTYTGPDCLLSSLTLPMGQKRDYREHIKKQEYVQPKGFSLAKQTATKKWMKIRKDMNEMSLVTDLGYRTLKKIEGQFGAGIMEYFKLLKWMIFLNLLLCIPILFIIVPQFVISPMRFEERFVNSTSSSSPAPFVMTTTANYPTTQTSTEHVGVTGSAHQRIQQLNSVVHDEQLGRYCTARYKTGLNTGQQQWYLYILDFIQGTGYFESTPLFYGYYFNKTSEIGGKVVYPWYNMTVAYLMVTMFFFIISLSFIVVSTSSGLQHNAFADHMIYYKHINQVFAGWDFGLYKEKAVKIKKSLISHEIKRELEERRRAERYKSRSSRKTCIILLIRLSVSLVVLGILVGCAAAVYYAQIEADKRLTSRKERESEMQQSSREVFNDFVWQYLPSVLITIMYAIFPIFFKKLATLEKWYPATEQNITIARIVALRLGTVLLLLLPIYISVVSCSSSSSEANVCGTCDYSCWETFIGQQIYKLVLLDLFVIVGVVFFVEFPRKCIWKRYKESSVIIRSIGQEEFDIPVNVMDIVYTQTLCWVGTFYCPLLPFITLFKVIVFFYVRKLSLFHNQKPAAALCRASSMNLFFKCVLTVSFFISVVAVGISIGVATPSRTCGPFRIHSSINDLRSEEDNVPYSMFGAIAEAMLLLPDFPRDLINILGSTPALATMIATLSLTIYVYSARTNGQVRLVELLRDTLKREEKDKRWLLTKVNSTLRQELSLKTSK